MNSKTIVPEAMRIGRARLTAGLDRFERIDLATHQEIFGPMRRVTARQLIEMVEAIDLRGRGGAGFPFARKVRAVMDACAQKKTRPFLVINGTEGEPGSAKDKMLLLRSPYLVLGGALLVARALNARMIIIGVTNPAAAASVADAAKAEPDLKKIVRVVEVPERFVAGEASALVNAVNGKNPLPSGKRKLTAESGVDGQPTLLSNAETFAQVAVLAMLGEEGYASDGTPDEPGTLLLTVGGSADRPAVVEVPPGVPLGTVLDICEATAPEGVLVGGYHGMWIPGDVVDDVPVSRAGLDAAGGTLGAGIILPLAAGTCPMGEVARIVRYMAKESSGQCGPCKLGLPGLARSMSALADGSGGIDTLDMARRAASVVRGRGACSHPDGVSRFVLSALDVFSDDLTAHLFRGSCGRRSAASCRSGRRKSPRCGSRWTGPAARGTGCARRSRRRWSSWTTRATRCSWTCRCRSGWRRKPSRRSRCARRWPSARWPPAGRGTARGPASRTALGGRQPTCLLMSSAPRREHMETDVPRLVPLAVCSLARRTAADRRLPASSAPGKEADESSTAARRGRSAAHRRAGPGPGTGESLVQVTAVGICGSDLHWWGEAGIGDATLSRPWCWGTRPQASSRTGRARGERVAIDPAIPYGTCRPCRDGYRNLCLHIRFAGHGGQDGAMREFLAWPSDLLHPLPDALSDADGALLEPLGCRHPRPRPGPPPAGWDGGGGRLRADRAAAQPVAPGGRGGLGDRVRTAAAPPGGGRRAGRDGAWIRPWRPTRPRWPG